MLWASLAVALLCCIQQGPSRRADAADAADDAADVDDWIAESVARAQHCFATAERIDPRHEGAHTPFFICFAHSSDFMAGMLITFVITLFFALR
jgi:hypothetical protein